MTGLPKEARFDFIPGENQAFIHAYDDEMHRLGYDFGGKIGSGYCWGKYMLIYRRTGVKSERVYARIYIWENGNLVLRLFLNDIDKHRLYLETAPAHIKTVFTGEAAACNHDRDEGGGACRFRKLYTLDGRLIEKCSGITFEFRDPDLEKLPDYINLFAEFNPGKRSTAKR